MRRRGLLPVLFAMLLLAGTAGIAAAASAPAPTPPPLCFVVKNGALPTCTQGPGNTWTAIYPKHSGNLDPSEFSNDTVSGGGHGAVWWAELVVAIAAILGIGIIVWRNWLRPGRAVAAPAVPVISVPAAPVAPSTPAGEPPATNPPNAPPSPTPPPGDGYFATGPGEPSA